MKRMVAYTDGSFNGDVNVYGYACVVYSHDTGELTALYGGGNEVQWLDSRNVSGEVMAAIVAMKTAKEAGYDSLTIFHDYEGIAKWCTREWKTRKEISRLLLSFYDVYTLQGLNVNFVKVKGHSGDVYNTAADKFANQGVTTFLAWKALHANSHKSGVQRLPLNKTFVNDHPCVRDYCVLAERGNASDIFLAN